VTSVSVALITKILKAKPTQLTIIKDPQSSINPGSLLRRLSSKQLWFVEGGK